MVNFIDQQQKRMNQLERYGIFYQQAAIDFHQKVAERLFAKGHMKLYYLELDDVPLASQCMYEFNGALQKLSYRF